MSGCKTAAALRATWYSYEPVIKVKEGATAHDIEMDYVNFQQSLKAAKAMKKYIAHRRSCADCQIDVHNRSVS